MLKNTVTTPLPLQDDPSFRLTNIKPGQCIKEMGFHYHIQSAGSNGINNALKDEKTFTPISEATLRGYLTGFVDLIFEHRHKYYIVDYKTNHLGYYAEDYSPEKLIEAMTAHNYGLQYWLYTLVLHRYLKNYLSEYCYTTSFGGVLYLFVRGMDKSGNGIFYTRPAVDTLENLEGCLDEDTVH